MPWIVPFIPLIAAGAGVAGAGVGAYDANNASIDQNAAQKANADALLKQQQTQANQANLTKQEAVLGAQGQAQEQTGGSLTDSGTASLTDLLAGYPGYQSGSGSGVSGGAGGSSSTAPAIAPTSLSSTGGSGSTPDIAAILAALRGGSSGVGGSGSGSISGGNWQFQPAQPQSQFELANPVIG